MGDWIYAAALVAGPVARYFGWRAVFFVGILPALVTLWIRRGVPESELWEDREVQRGRNDTVATDAAHRDATSYVSTKFSAIFRRPYLKHTLALLLFNFFALFAWWGLFTWIPPYLSLPVSHGGREFGVMRTTTLLVTLNLFGMLPGYMSFGWVADHLGRRKAFLVYSLSAAFLIPLYAAARSSTMLLVMGTLVALFGTGLFSGSGIMGSEIFPTGVRARALGFTYNGARAMSSVAPLVIGRVGQSKGLGWAFYLCAGGYLFGCIDDDTIAGDARKGAEVNVYVSGENLGIELHSSKRLRFSARCSRTFSRMPVTAAKRKCLRFQHSIP